jgi:hypothetical protein
MKLVLCAALVGCGRLGFDADGGACPSNMVTNAPYAGGAGTEGDPFQLCSPAQLSAISARPDDLDASFVLEQDLDFDGVTFTGIGALAAPFTGSFDGNGKIISNLTITAVTGEPAALVNAAFTASIEDLTLRDVTVAGAMHVASIIGYCERSQVRRATVTNAVIRGETNVGGLVGEAEECRVVGASLTATVEGTKQAIGGVVGMAGSSSFLDITATVDVNAPLASEVGGMVGEDAWSPVTLQNVIVEGTVVGNGDVAGIVGFNGDGSDIYRSRFTGSIRGNTGVGGFVGGAYDSPFHVYSTSVDADITGNAGVGGFAGRHYYRTRFLDSYFTGTLTGVGAQQLGFGGFFGDVEYYGWVERSYVDVTIDSQASTVGGFIGRIGYWSSDTTFYDITNSFSAANVTGSSASNSISLWVGENIDPNPFAGTGSHYWSGGSCTNLGGGGCGAGGIAADVAELQGPGSPLAAWDFSSVWQTQSGGFPTLRLEQNHAPIPSACAGTAIYGVHYACDLTVTDLDPNETRIVMLEREHSCPWMNPNVLALRGTPTPGVADACTISFSVTDGPHTSAIQTVALEVHAGVVLAPTDSTGAAYHMGIHPVGSPAITQLFTLTNREAVPVTGLSVTGLAGDFAFAGGTFPGTGGSCTTMLGTARTCTVAISYTPTIMGPVEVPLAIGFTAARGPVTYTFRLSGHGN